MGVRGYIRNLDDGRVEAIIEPNGVDISQIISALKKGSNMSRVDNIEYEEIDSNISFDDFSIRY